MLLNVSGVAAVSGGSTPLAFLLGGIACLALAFVVIGFTRRMASAGYAYTYASRSLGKGIPIAIIAATAFAIVFYLWATYSMATGFGVGNGAKWGADPVALKTIAATFVGPWLGTLVEIGGMCSAFIVCVACATAGARTLFAMGREGVLPAAFGRTHHRFKTPVNATVTVAVVATLMALLIGYPLSDSLFGQPFSNYYFWATTGTLVIVAVYIMICLGGIAFFARTRAGRRWNPLAHVTSGCRLPACTWRSGMAGTGRGRAAGAAAQPWPAAVSALRTASATTVAAPTPCSAMSRREKACVVGRWRRTAR